MKFLRILEEKALGNVQLVSKSLSIVVSWVMFLFGEEGWCAVLPINSRVTHTQSGAEYMTDTRKRINRHEKQYGPYKYNI